MDRDNSLSYGIRGSFPYSNAYDQTEADELLSTLNAVHGTVPPTPHHYWQAA